jgi:hypothetical protein
VYSMTVRRLNLVGTMTVGLGCKEPLSVEWKNISSVERVEVAINSVVGLIPSSRARGDVWFKGSVRRSDGKVVHWVTLRSMDIGCLVLETGKSSIAQDMEDIEDIEDTEDGDNNDNSISAVESEEEGAVAVRESIGKAVWEVLTDSDG